MQKYNAEEILDQLMKYFRVATSQELAQKIGVAQNTISGWKSRNSVSSIIKKLYELNIYDEIMLDLEAVNNFINGRKLINKIKKIENVKTDPEIAEILGVLPSTFRGWIQRDAVQHETIILYALKKNIDLNSLYSETENIKSIEKSCDEVVFTAFKQAYRIAEANDTLDDLTVSLMRFTKSNQ